MRCRPARVALLLVFATACAHRQAAAPTAEAPPPGSEERPPPQESAAPPARRTEEGLASFYGRRHKGRRTASGAIYDPGKMTCAHRNAPFGTRLRVTDVESGREVVVTVNDRGPFVRGRIIDLSLAAARELGMVARGVARVRIERLTP